MQTRSGTQIGHGTSVHDGWQHNDLLAHTRRHPCAGRLSDSSQEHWTAEVYDISWPSARQRQQHHIPQHWWNDTQRVFSGNRIEFDRSGGVYWLRAGTSAKTKSGTGGVKVLMGFEQDNAGVVEAQPARPGTVHVVLPSDAEVELHEPTHLPTRNWCRHCVRATGKESPHHKASPGGVSKFAD